MLKSNSKKYRENIRAYIVENFNPEWYTKTPPETFLEIACFILHDFRSEKYHIPEDLSYYHSEFDAFSDWCAGLPTLLNTCYFYNRSAVDDLCKILEEPAEEKARYTEEQAVNLLTSMIYIELLRAENEMRGLGRIK